MSEKTIAPTDGVYERFQRQAETKGKTIDDLPKQLPERDDVAVLPNM